MPRLMTALSVLILSGDILAGEPSSLLQVRIGQTTHTGSIVAKNSDDFWLLQRDGRLDRLAIQDVADYQPLAGKFRPLPAADLRDRLIQEFGRGYEVVGSSHYLVVAGRGQAKRFVTLFEELYRHLHVYLAARNFPIREPEFPLVAVVFPDQAKFVEYCLREQVRPSAGLRGYYLLSSNRVALYDTGADAELDETVIHEAVHQAAYNLGLHSRIGENPQWVVEGLATTFEPENFRRPLPSTPLSAKINRDRYLHFRNYQAARRPPKSLEEFVKGDEFFQAATLDGYAQAWALTFFLLETRQQQYSDYLKRIAARPPLQPYESEARLDDFRQAFGDDLAQLDADFLRFMSGLRK